MTFASISNLKGTSVIVQWLGLCILNVGGAQIWSPGEGTRFHIPQLKRRIPHATAKTQNSQINKYFKTDLKGIVSSLHISPWHVGDEKTDPPIADGQSR